MSFFRVAASLDGAPEPHADRARQNGFQCGVSAILLPQKLLSQYACYFRLNLCASGDYIFAHSLFERTRGRTAVLGKLERGNPDVGVQNDNHR